MLRTNIIESESFFSVMSFERFSDDPEGLFHARFHNDQRTLDYLNQTGDYILDWSSLTIDRKRCCLFYKTSSANSVPVYILNSAERVKIDWDYSRLLNGHDPQIDWESTLAHIGGTAPYSPRTLINGLYRSTAGATLVAYKDRISLRLPAAVSKSGPQRLASGVVPEDLFFKTIKALFEARPLQRDRTAVEVSGGMDSGLAALALAEVLGPGVLSTGAQFSGDMGVAQRARRQLLCDRGGFDNCELPAHRFLPFSPCSLRRNRFGVWPQDETYPEIFETIFSVLAKAGIDTLVSGFGGDELYAAYEGEEENTFDLNDSSNYRYLTDEGRRLAMNALGDYPAGPLQETCLRAAASRSQRLLRHGIWPVYPYHSPALVDFVSKLPWGFRRDRQLLRRALTKYSGSGIFEHDYIKESFEEIALQGVIENREYLLSVISQSDIMKDDYIRLSELIKVLSSDRATLSSELNQIFPVLTTCCFFQSSVR